MRRTTCLLVVGLIVTAAGCGGAGSHHLSHDEFIKQANTICVDYNKRVAALGNAGTRSATLDPTQMSVALRFRGTIANLMLWSEKALPILRQSVATAKQLRPPNEDEAGWKAYAAEADKAIIFYGNVINAAKRHDKAVLVRLAAEGQKEAARTTRIGHDLGLAECS
jgi:hypothetical protein